MVVDSAKKSAPVFLPEQHQIARMSAKPRLFIALLFLILSQQQMAEAAEWPPADPADYTTKTDFTVA
jgi:hypothetical protein